MPTSRTWLGLHGPKPQRMLCYAHMRKANAAQDERPFVSAKKVMMDMGEPYASTLELVCFHTVSKGTLGECGMRGG